MKIRNGFISNSSSSSFTCDVCGLTESGWDAIPSYFEMIECQNGHIICYYHVDKEIQVDEEDLLISELCPICNLEILPTKEMFQYLLKLNNLTKGEIAEQIRNTFDDYTKFKKYIEEK